MMQKLGVGDLDVTDRRVFVRVDYNVPLRGDTEVDVADDRRIRASLETLRHLLERGAKLVLASHLGRPKGKRRPELSLEPVARRLEEILAEDATVPVRFAADCIGPEAEKAAAALKTGEVLLLENLRYHPGETENDPEFARSLASLADCYVNDAFGSAHRAHASTAGICSHMPSAAGFLMERELTALSSLGESPQRPYVALLGGAKVADKIPLALNLLDRVDAILIGGGMAYTFLAAEGGGIGDSLFEPDRLDMARDVLDRARTNGVRVCLPLDHVVVSTGEGAPGAARTTDGREVGEGRRAVDIGPKTVEAFRNEIAAARTVLWNGPVGWFEKKPFDEGTAALARAIAGSSAYSVIGGGDSAAAVGQLGLASSFSHVSTGGGASLELLSGRTLPGVAALTDRKGSS